MAAIRATVLVFLAVSALTGAELLPAERSAPFTRDLAMQPVARYQAGSLFSRDSSLSILWVENIIGGRNSLEKPLALPESFGVLISDVAAGFDGTIAAAVSGHDREGEGFAAIAWLNADGSLIRVVRTSPFGARQISFTSDGSLWAIGMETKVDPVRKETPEHDVLRRYGPDGGLLQTYFPRLSLSTDWKHPAFHGGMLATSRERVGFVSDSARTWAVLSASGVILGQGTVSAPEGLRIYVAAITDSGRLFVSGSWRGGKARAPGKFSGPPVFEIDQTTGELQLVDTETGTFPGGQTGPLIGSEGEQLVFYSGVSRQLVWARVD